MLIFEDRDKTLITITVTMRPNVVYRTWQHILKNVRGIKFNSDRTHKSQKNKMPQKGHKSHIYSIGNSILVP